MIDPIYKNKREPYQATIKPPFHEVKQHKFTKREKIIGQDGKPIKDDEGNEQFRTVVITDPNEIAVYREMVEAILSRYVYDAATNQHYVRSTSNNVWEHIKHQNVAFDKLTADISAHPPQGFNPNVNQQVAISKAFIEYVMDNPALQAPFGGMDTVPFAPELFFRDGKIWINDFRDNSIQPDLSQPLTSDEEQTLEDYLGGVVRINLANGRGKKSFSELLDIINNTNVPDVEYAFRYIVQNMAHIYMRSGHNIKTNLALCGKPGGMGKNLTAGIMSKLIGTNVYHEVKKFDSEYNGWLRGKQFVLLDEIENGNKNKIFNQFVKTCTINETVTIRAMRQDEVTIKNQANYWIFSNSLFPYQVDTTERRTIFIQTFWGDDADSRKRIADKNAKNISAIIPALAKFFHMIDLDTDFVDEHRETELGRYILNESASSMEKFFRSADLTNCIVKETGRERWVLKSAQWKSEYQDWCGVNHQPREGSPAGILANMPWRYKSGKNWFVNLDELEKYRGGVPYNCDPDTYDPPEIERGEMDDEIPDEITPADTEESPVVKARLAWFAEKQRQKQ